MRELFIYFRARAVDDGRVRDAVQAMHQQLRPHLPDLSARLLRRPDEAEGGLHTWMEIYAMGARSDLVSGVGGFGGRVRGGLGITAEIQTAIELAAQILMPLVVGERHIEVFDSLVD